MKKYLSKLLLILSFLSLTACVSGGNYNNALYLEEDKGKMIMTYTDNYSEQSEHLNVNIDDINKIVIDNCPNELDLDINDDGNTVIYTFTLLFNNLNEYEDKCKKILEKGNISYNEPLIESDIKGNLFLKKIYYKENFHSNDLMAWFINALIDNNVISNEYQDKIINSFSVETYYDNQEIKIDGMERNIDLLASIGIIELSIDTLIIDENNIERNIIFYLDKTFYLEKKSLINDYFSNLLNDKYNIEYEEYDDVIKMIISPIAKDIEGINEFMSLLFKGDTNFSLLYDGVYLFDHYEIKEKIDFSEYIGNDSDINKYYYLDGSRKYLINNEEIDLSSGFIDLGNDIKSNINLISDSNPIINNMIIEIDVLNDNEIMRTITLEFDGDYQDKYLYKKLSSIFKEDAIINHTENNNIVIITTKEDKNNNPFNKIFNSNNNFKAKNSCTIFGIKCSTSLEDNFDLSWLSKHEIRNISYQLNNVKSFKDLDQENGMINGKAYIISNTDYYPESLNIKFSSSDINYVNIGRLIMFIFILIALLETILTLLKYKSINNYVEELNKPELDNYKQNNTPIGGGYFSNRDLFR